MATTSIFTATRRLSAGSKAAVLPNQRWATRNQQAQSRRAHGIECARIAVEKQTLAIEKAKVAQCSMAQALSDLRPRTILRRPRNAVGGCPTQRSVEACAARALPAIARANAIASVLSNLEAEWEQEDLAANKRLETRFGAAAALRAQLQASKDAVRDTLSTLDA